MHVSIKVYYTGKVFSENIPRVIARWTMELSTCTICSYQSFSGQQGLSVRFSVMQKL